MKIQQAAFVVVAGILLVLAAFSPAPVRGEEESPYAMRARGKTSYGLFCRNCHGKAGLGDGSVAELLKIPPADLTRISERRDGEFPAEEIRQIIDGRKKNVRAHGSEMPVWGDAFQVTEETEDEDVVRSKIEGLVSYLESIQVEEEPGRGTG